MRALGLLWLVVASGCVVTGAAKQPAVGMWFYEGAGSTQQERLAKEFPFSVAVITGAKLRFNTAADLLKAAQEDPRKLMRASRTMDPSNNVVVLATYRAQEQSGGSITGVAVYQMAFSCDPHDLESPGDLTNCVGFVLRVTRTWPGEVYEMSRPVISLIPEGGTAIGKLSGDSQPTSQFRVKLVGDFVASLGQLGEGAKLETWAVPPPAPVAK